MAKLGIVIKISIEKTNFKKKTAGQYDDFLKLFYESLKMRGNPRRIR